MRNLSLLLVLGGLTACAGGAEEICGNSLDDDGDGVVDNGCEADVEDCTNGTDDDGDALVDCDDLVDCSAELTCTPENCSDGADNNGDGAIDCADSDCTADPLCQDFSEWVLTGAGTLAGGTYTGTLASNDTVTQANEVGSTYSVGDNLCEIRYNHTLSTAPGTACADCEWAFELNGTDVALDSSFAGGAGYEGPLCDGWYDFTAGSEISPAWMTGLGFDVDYYIDGYGDYRVMVGFYADNTTWYPFALETASETTTGSYAFVYTLSEDYEF